MSTAALGTFENPRPYDILCGRNRNSFNNIGNRRFRITISMNVEKYNALPTRHERSKFIASLAQTLRYEVGFRFLKRTPGKKSKNSTTELSDEEIRAKVGHALRDLSTAMQEQKNEGDKDAPPESKVPRPGPYKTQDKALEQSPQQQQQQHSLRRMVSMEVVSSSALEDIKKPSLNPMAITQEEEHHEARPDVIASAPDLVPSSSGSSPLHLMPLLKDEEEARRLLEEEEDDQDNQLNLLEAKIKAIEQDDCDYQSFSMDFGEACDSLSPTHLIPSSMDDDDEEDYFEMLHDFSWRTDEVKTNDNNNYSGRSMDRSFMSIGNSSCDAMSILSDNMETLSLVSQ